MTDRSSPLIVPRRLRRGHRKGDEPAYIEEGRDLLAYLAAALGLQDLSACKVLDMGCGTKFTQAIISHDIPIGKYIGVDVYRDMIEFLGDHTPDGRFSFHHVDTHNEMYNPGGEKLSEQTRLPIEEYSCDVICLFSVFTHLAPDDFSHMLKLMRRYASQDCQLLFTLYLDEPTGNGHGLVEQIANKQDTPYVPSGKPFFDAYPGKPLQWALYTREYALELTENTGWKVDKICLPNALAQHHFICRPV